MSLSRFLVGAAAAALVSAAVPLAAKAQSGGWKTSCNDGTTSMSTGANACDGHGGIHRVHTVIQHRTPKSNSPVTQAGTPKSTGDNPGYEERRGWRWGHHNEEKRREERREERRAERREDRREDRRDEKHRVVRCRDGRSEKAVGKGHEVCKHHGGLAH